MADSFVKRLYAKFRQTYFLELNMLLFFLSSMVFSSAAYPLFYTKVCQNLYPRPQDPSEVYLCDDFESIQSDDSVQKSSTNWFMYGELAKFIPNMFGTMLMGSFGDKYGRKPPMLIAVVSLLLYLVLYWIFVTFEAIPIYVITIMAAVTALGGTATVFLSMQFSEVGETVKDENLLTVRYAVLTAFWSGAIVVGGNVAPFLLTYAGNGWTSFVGLLLMICAFTSVLILFPDRPPSKEAIVVNAENDSTTTGSDATPKPRKSACAMRMDEFTALYKSAWHTISRKRPNNGRLYLIVACIVGVVYGSEDSGLDSINVLYVYRAPLLWSPQLYTWWSAMTSLSQLLGSLIGAFLFKKFKFTDMSILIISMISAALKMIGIGIGRETWIMFLSIVLGSLSTVGFSALRSFVVQLGSREETGELLSLINLSVSWCTIFSALVFNNTYSATLELYAGFTYFFVAFTLVLCIIAITIVYVTKQRATQSQEPEIKNQID